MKKKVRFVESVASEKFSYKPGDIAVLDATLAGHWVAQGRCTDVENDADDLKRQISELQAQLKAVEPKPAK